jgi:hypothetical protein
VAKSVGIRRQAREDVDAREAVGGAGRAMGADRASAVLFVLHCSPSCTSDQLEWERAIADSIHLQAWLHNRRRLLLALACCLICWQQLENSPG